MNKNMLGGNEMNYGLYTFLGLFVIAMIVSTVVVSKMMKE
jgi:hypothetical protein